MRMMAALLVGFASVTLGASSSDACTDFTGVYRYINPTLINTPTEKRITQVGCESISETEYWLNAIDSPVPTESHTLLHYSIDTLFRLLNGVVYNPDHRSSDVYYNYNFDAQGDAFYITRDAILPEEYHWNVGLDRWRIDAQGNLEMTRGLERTPGAPVFFTPVVAIRQP